MAYPPELHTAAVQPGGRRRITKACDRCRRKKIKCDGKAPCPRCKDEDAICIYNARARNDTHPISIDYVRQLELQHQVLIKTLKTAWKRYGPATPVDSEDPSIHDMAAILDILGDSSRLQSLKSDDVSNENVPEIAPNYDNDGNTESPRQSVSRRGLSPTVGTPVLCYDGMASPSSDIYPSQSFIPTTVFSLQLPWEDAGGNGPPHSLKRKRASEHHPMLEGVFPYVPVKANTFPQALDTSFSIDSDLQNPQPFNMSLDHFEIPASNIDYMMAESMSNLGGADWSSWFTEPQQS